MEESSNSNSNSNSNSIVESRQELMISPTTPANPTLRTSHFLKPSINSDFQAISTISPLSLPSSFSPTSDPLPQLTVNFIGWKNTPKNWKQWVQQMASIHSTTWKKAGIYEAIFNSTYKFNKNDELILRVAERWCPDTNSFVFPWGEATVTLEDMLIAGYSVLGSPVFEPLETEEYKAIEQALIRERRELNKTPVKKPLQSSWLKVFMDSDSEMEHEAFLSLWLSRFVLPTSRDVICECVFPIAIHLARGTRIALAPAVLSTIYRDLRLMKEKIVSLATLDGENDGNVVVTTFAPFQLLLVWVWERFAKLSPKPNLLKNGETRFAQWDNVKCNPENVRLVFESSKESFNWRPYTKIVENWDMPKFYREHEMRVSPDSGVDEEMLSFILCLKVSELVGLDSDCIEQYLPQRVARQFGFDQDVPGFVAQRNATCENAWDCYIRPVTDKMECYIPSRLFEGDVTSRYLEWWNRSVLVQHQEKTSKMTPKVPKEKEKGQKTLSSSLTSRKSLKRKGAAGELNVSKVSGKSSKRTKKGESSKTALGKKETRELNGLKVSAPSSEVMKKDDASKSPKRKKASRKLNGLKVSAKGAEIMKSGSRKKGGTSKSLKRKKAADKLKEARVSENSPKRMTEGEIISSSNITPKATKDNVEEINRPAISLVVELNELPVPPGFSRNFDTVKAGDPTADDNITIAEMMKCKKKKNSRAGNKQYADGKKSAGKLDSHFSPNAANEFAKTPDIALSGVREGQNEAIENENDGDSKTASSQSHSYSSLPDDNESLKGFDEEKYKQTEACDCEQTRSDGNESDVSHRSQSHLSANERSLNVLDPVASNEKLKHIEAGGSQDGTGDKAVAADELGGFHSHAESEPLEISEPAPLVETPMLSEETNNVENVVHGDSISSANNKALKVVKPATSKEEEAEISKEAEESQDIDIQIGARQLDQSESHSSSIVGNETPKNSEPPEKLIFTGTRSLTGNDSSRENVAHNGNKGSNEYSIGAPKLMMLEDRIEKLGTIMAARRAALSRDICGE